MSTLSLQTFVPLVDKHGLSDEERPVPVEFVGDHERCIMINLLSLLLLFFFFLPNASMQMWLWETLQGRDVYIYKVAHNREFEM